MNRFDELLSRQHVERVCPPVPWWSKALMWAGGMILAWVLLLLLAGGLMFWLDAIAEWWIA